METERLELWPLTAGQLALLIDDAPALERELNCRYRAEPIEGFFKGILQGQLSICAGDPDNYRWHSFWLMIRKGDRVVVGSADFKASPDGDGRVEIGYGLGEGFCGSGYMTEAVRGMCDFAFANGVRAVIAETECDNAASQNVLRRCGFTLYRSGETLWWEKTAG